MARVEGNAARLPRPLRRLRRRRSPAASSTRGRSTCPGCERALLPAARRAVARRRPAAARAGAAARRRRPLAGGAAGRRGRMSESLDAKVAARRQAEMVASLRAAGARPGDRRRRAAPAPASALEELCDLCGKPLDRRPSPPAPPRRPPHPLHLRELPGAARRATRSCARPARGRVWLDDFELSDETWASFGIPIGLAFFIDSSASGGIVGALPEPGRGDRVRARARAPGASCGPPTRC